MASLEKKSEKKLESGRDIKELTCKKMLRILSRISPYIYKKYVFL